MTLYYPPTQNGLQKTLGAQLDEATTSAVTLNNATGIQNKAGVFVIDRIDTGGTEKEAAVREYISFTGVSGSTLTGLTRGLGGSTDQDHAINAVVEFVMDVVQEQGIIDTVANGVTLDGTETITGNKTFTGTNSFTTGVNTFASGKIKVTNLTVGSATITPPSSTSTLASLALAETFTNKRINPRVVSTTDDATAVIDSDITDIYQLTAVANATEFTVTGTPVAGQKLIVRLKDAGVAKNLTWTGFTARGATPPAVTVANKTHYVGFIYNATAVTFDCVAAIVEA